MSLSRRSLVVLLLLFVLPVSPCTAWSTQEIKPQAELERMSAEELVLEMYAPCLTVTLIPMASNLPTRTGLETLKKAAAAMSYLRQLTTMLRQRGPAAGWFALPLQTAIAQFDAGACDAMANEAISRLSPTPQVKELPALPPLRR